MGQHAAGPLVDACPDDPLMTEPGACGCGVSDQDVAPANGRPDCVENGVDYCPDGPLSGFQRPGACGCWLDERDVDGDGAAYCVDEDEAGSVDFCPDDPDKRLPGICGCGLADRDDDANAVPDCLENAIDYCPQGPWSHLSLPGPCGCGLCDGCDFDGDGLPHCVDPTENGSIDFCPDDPGKTRPGICGCGVRDDDTHQNGVPDCLQNAVDYCPDGPFGWLRLPGTCGCWLCEECDFDQDAVPQCVDPDQRGDFDFCPDDPAKMRPGVCGCGLADTDRDSNNVPDCVERGVDYCPDGRSSGSNLPGVCGCWLCEWCDFDGDGIPYCVDVDHLAIADLCPDDPAKLSPGICGCGVPDADRDGNDVPDCLENGVDYCPEGPGGHVRLPGICGCWMCDWCDSDGDEIPHCIDPEQNAEFDFCPDDPGKSRPGVCGCGVSDVDRDSNAVPDCLERGIDYCPEGASSGLSLPGTCGCWLCDWCDSDGDAIPYCVDPDELDIDDLCPDDPEKRRTGLCGCGVADDDRDGNDVPDCLENGVDYCPEGPWSHLRLPGICGCWMCDWCDSDGDAIPHCIDPGQNGLLDFCPDDDEKTRPGTCGCGLADADSDSDLVPDCLQTAVDYCPDGPYSGLSLPGTCGCWLCDWCDDDGDAVPHCADPDQNGLLDFCPDDPDKTQPGICGCGLSDEVGDFTFPVCLAMDHCWGGPFDHYQLPGVCGCWAPNADNNGNAVPACVDVEEGATDSCPHDPAKRTTGICGCGIPDQDLNENGIADCLLVDCVPYEPIAGGGTTEQGLLCRHLPQAESPEALFAGIHEQREYLDDPYLPRRGPVNEDPRRGPVRRGPFASVQVNVSENLRNILGDAANEPSLAVDPTDPNRMVIGWRQFDNVASNFRQAGWGYTRDGGGTWRFPGVIEPGVFRSDPVLAENNGGSIFYYSLTRQYPAGTTYHCDLFRSDDGGESWQPGVYGFGGDKQWITVDRTHGPGAGNLYAYWTRFFSCCGNTNFTRSLDDGASFADVFNTPASPFWGTLTVNPDGQLFIFGGDRMLLRSLNAGDPNAAPVFEVFGPVDLGGGASGLRGGPNPGGLLGQFWVVSDHSSGLTRSNLYILATVPAAEGLPTDVVFTRSEDDGETWSAPVRVHGDDDADYQWFGTIDVAPDGRIDVVWNDTKNSGVDNVSELFYAYSFDGGESWSPAIPAGPAFDSWLGWPNQNKIGDYSDMYSDSARANLAYAATFNGEQDVYFVQLGDCNGNGIHDGREAAADPALDEDGDALLDACETCLAHSADFVPCLGGPENRGLAAACTSADYDGDHDADLFDFAQFQVAYLGNTDCNDNLVPDECDFLFAFQTDCNNNRVLDECELAVALDCNGNNLLDDCERARFQFLGEFEGHGYYTSDAVYTYAEAEQVTCLFEPAVSQPSRAYIAVLNSCEEQSWVNQQLSDTAFYYWIGLSDTASEGNFAWANGEAPAFVHWTPGYPLDCCGGADHVVLNYVFGDRSGSWLDLPMDTQWRVLIELAP
jgi:hypothetical protein